MLDGRPHVARLHAVTIKARSSSINNYTFWVVMAITQETLHMCRNGNGFRQSTAHLEEHNF